MELLFIFFVLPVVTIILAIVLQKLLRSPILVALTFFAIYLIIAFTVFIEDLAIFLIAAIIYTIIAFIAAYIAMIIWKIRERLCCCNNNNSCNSNNNCYRNIELLAREIATSGENISNETQNFETENVRK